MSEWQPISANAPEKLDPNGNIPGYLCLLRNDAVPDCGYPYIIANGVWLNLHGNKKGVTHWIPLPPAPGGT